MKNLISFIIFFTTSLLHAQFKDYMGNPDINSVLLSEEVTFEVNTLESSTLRKKSQSLILNRKAKALRNIQIYYDQFRSLTDFSLVVRDVEGKEVDKLRIRDLEDVSIMSGMASDGRVKKKWLNNYKYPFIIELSYKMEYNGNMFYPEWRPQSEEGLKVVNAKFEVIDKVGNGVRFHSIGLEGPIENKNGLETHYYFEVNNLEPFFFEKWNYNYSDYTPTVLAAPVKFKMGDYSGSLSTWSEYGKWISQLNADKSSLENLDLSELDVKISNQMTDVEKIEAVYDYLQKNTRYVSIQLGIGGWEPFPSSYVHEKKYGDCKALSNYTISLLNRYDVKGFYTLIKAGAYTSEIPKDFPNAHFNHAIVTVPLMKDTIFLECTSQLNPVGYQGSFTGNRNALIIKDGGAELIRTKKYEEDENLQVSTINLDISLNGFSKAIEVDIERYYSGIEIENGQFYTRYYENESDNVDWFVDNSGFGSIQLDTFQLLKLSEGVVPRAGYKAKFKRLNAIREAGKRILFDPSIFFDSYLERIKTDSVSKSIDIRYGYTQIDSLHVNLPNDYRLSNATNDSIAFSSKFGSYLRKQFISDGKLLVVRKFVFKDGRYDSNEFSSFKQFVNKVISNDRKKISLINRT